MEKLLTISIAAYNVEKFLDNALHSLVDTRILEKIEVLVVDDGSTDRTREIAIRYHEQYPKTFFCISKENGGYGSTINRALSHANGRYFKLLDGDDWYNTEELVKLIDILETCNCDMVVTGYTEVYEGTQNKKEFSYKSYKAQTEYQFENVCADISLKMHAVMFKTALLKENHVFITEKCFYTDTEFLLIPIMFVNSVMFCHVDIYQYRLALSGQSVSIEGMRKHYKDAERVLSKLLKVCDLKDMGKQKYQFFVENLAVTADFQLRAYLCMKPQKQIKKQLIEFDQLIKMSQQKVYERMQKPMTWLLRKTNYHTYILYSLYIVFRMRMVNLLRKH